MSSPQYYGINGYNPKSNSNDTGNVDANSGNNGK